MQVWPLGRCSLWLLQEETAGRRRPGGGTPEEVPLVPVPVARQGDAFLVLLLGYHNHLKENKN